MIQFVFIIIIQKKVIIQNKQSFTSRKYCFVYFTNCKFPIHNPRPRFLLDESLMKFCPRFPPFPFCFFVPRTYQQWGRIKWQCILINPPERERTIYDNDLGGKSAMAGQDNKGQLEKINVAQHVCMLHLITVLEWNSIRPLMA